MTKNPRIVIIRLSSIGDVLHCTPVARTLKESMPECHITWIVGQVAADMLRYNPYIDELYVWPREQWEKAMRAGRFREAWQLWQQLRSYFKTQQYDIALDIHGLFLSGMVTAASHTPRRIGLNNTRELNHLFMTETAPPPVGPHVIQHYLSALQPLNITTSDYRMTLVVPPSAAEFAENLLLQHQVSPQDKLVAVNPVTTWSAKNWPPESFVTVIQELSHHAKVLLCGGPGDRTISDKIVKLAGVPIIDAVGRTSLLEMAALLQRSQILLVGDTGPLHMAIAVGTPSISIFGATNYRKYGPLDPGHTILTGETTCPPCHKTICRTKDLRCLKSITPETVVKHTLSILNSR